MGIPVSSPLPKSIDLPLPGSRKMSPLAIPQLWTLGTGGIALQTILSSWASWACRVARARYSQLQLVLAGGHHLGGVSFDFQSLLDCIS